MDKGHGHESEQLDAKKVQISKPSLLSKKSEAMFLQSMSTLWERGQTTTNAREPPFVLGHSRPEEQVTLTDRPPIANYRKPGEATFACHQYEEPQQLLASEPNRFNCTGCGKSGLKVTELSFHRLMAQNSECTAVGAQAPEKKRAPQTSDKFINSCSQNNDAHGLDFPDGPAQAVELSDPNPLLLDMEWELRALWEWRNYTRCLWSSTYDDEDRRFLDN